MKRTTIIAVFMVIVATGCRKDNQQITPAVSSNIGNNNAARTAQGASAELGQGLNYAGNWSQEYARRGAHPGGSEFISLVEANAMIGSYLYSIGAEKNDSDLRSFSVDADMLRAYLADNSIKNVKLVFAHTPEYMKAGNTGRYAGYQSGAMTIIIAAYTADGKYVFHNGMVLDHLSPCPSVCPSGQAGSELLY